MFKQVQALREAPKQAVVISTVALTVAIIALLVALGGRRGV